jgi:hypothetical protein
MNTVLFKKYKESKNCNYGVFCHAAAVEVDDPANPELSQQP